jgi:hypothetical protein
MMLLLERDSKIICNVLKELKFIKENNKGKASLSEKVLHRGRL